MSFETDRITRDWLGFRDFHLPRFLFNINPLNLWYNEPNPYDVDQHRTARQDITHSYVNLFVEGWRAAAYAAGHLLAVLVPFGLLAIIGVLL